MYTIYYQTIKLSPYRVNIARMHLNDVYTKPRVNLEHIEAKVKNNTKSKLRLYLVDTKPETVIY